MQLLARTLSSRFHYAWIAAAVVFLVLLASAGVRATPGVLIVPLQQAFGWTVLEISRALSLNLLLFGLMSPFAAALMLRIGVRRMVIGALMLLVCAVSASGMVTQSWQLILTWGLFVGIGTGSMALVLGNTVVNRWFVERRGVVLGALTASMATGQLIFLPILATVAGEYGWRYVIVIVACALAAVIPLVYFLLPEYPRNVGLMPYGATRDDPVVAPTGNPLTMAFAPLARAVKTRVFWLLFGSFFVCGLSTNGLVGTHMIAFCFDQGIPEVTAASMLAAMGICDLIGTTLSGWLSDRYDSRKLLFWYYGLRGLSLLFLPYSGFTFYGLSLFTVFYGLDWIATVPPTVRLITDNFGKKDGPILFGWVFVGHQIGASTAAWGAGFIRTELNEYLVAFLIAGVACVIAALGVLWINRPAQTGLNPAPAAA